MLTRARAARLRKRDSLAKVPEFLTWLECFNHIPGPQSERQATAQQLEDLCHDLHLLSPRRRQDVMRNTSRLDTKKPFAYARSAIQVHLRSDTSSRGSPASSRARAVPHHPRDAPREMPPWQDRRHADRARHDQISSAPVPTVDLVEADPGRQRHPGPGVPAPMPEWRVPALGPDGLLPNGSGMAERYPEPTFPPRQQAQDPARRETGTGPPPLPEGHHAALPAVDRTVKRGGTPPPTSTHQAAPWEDAAQGPSSTTCSAEDPLTSPKDQGPRVSRVKNKPGIHHQRANYVRCQKPHSPTFLSQRPAVRPP